MDLLARVQAATDDLLKYVANIDCEDEVEDASEHEVCLGWCLAGQLGPPTSRACAADLLNNPSLGKAGKTAVSNTHVAGF